MTVSSASASLSSPVPFAIARSMLSLGIEASLAFWTARASEGLPSTSPPPSRAATVIARASLVNSLPLRESTIAFLCLIDAHLECPDIPEPVYARARHPPALTNLLRGLGRGFTGRPQPCRHVRRRRISHDEHHQRGRDRGRLRRAALGGGVGRPHRALLEELAVQGQIGLGRPRPRELLGARAARRRRGGVA